MEKISRKDFIKKTATVVGASTVAPFIFTSCAKKTKTILIGITSDASGQYANSGGMDRKGMLMAIKEFNDQGGLLGRKITWVHQDTETTPATGSRVAERMIRQNNVNFLMGAVSSGVANAISQVAQRYGCIYLNTNSSSPTESGKNRHRVKFVWDGHGGNFATAAVKNAIQGYGKKWLLLTNDYVWGHNTSKATRDLAEGNGANVVDELLVPQNTRDFSSYLLKIQQIQPQVVAAAVGGDDLKSLRRQVIEYDLHKKIAWINNQQDWPDIYGQEVFGVFGTTWYYNLELPGVKEFVDRYKKMYPESRIIVPGNVFYNGYMATKELLSAIKRVGTLNNIAIIKELEKLKVSAKDRMQHHDAYMNPDTHHMEQTIYMATANDKPKADEDIFKIVSYISPDDAKVESTEGKLESYADTPTYEPN